MQISEFRFRGKWVVIHVPNAGGPCTVTVDGQPALTDQTFNSLREARASAIALLDREEEAE